MKKIGFIGTGGVSGVHLDYLKSREDVEIAALCDINEEQLKKRHDEYGGETFTDFWEMLDQCKPDAVWVCTPPQVREGPLLACADRKIPVFCEKPVELDLTQAQKIAADLKEHNQKVQIGYPFRSIPLVKQLQKELSDDKIHLIQSLYVCNVSLTRGLPQWFYDKKLSGGALIDQATHNFDLLRMLFGEVEHISGVVSNPVAKKEKGYTVDEVISLSFVFESGTVGSHIHTWVGDDWRNEIKLSGEKRFYRLKLLGIGELVVEDAAGNTRLFRPNQGVIHDHQNEIFLEMLDSDDWSKNPCTYAEGVKTLELTWNCDSAITR